MIGLPGAPEKKCALTIDLESWVHKRIGFIRDAQSRKKLDQGYVRKATEYLLGLLNKYDRRVTFFVLSEIWEWFPDLVEKIERDGHEVAYHTHTHREIREERDLVEELRLSEDFIERFKPVGFRAPEARIRTPFLGILAEHGFTYDSSSYANLRSSNIIHGVREIPISTLRVLNTSNKASGLPRNLTKTLALGELPFGSGFFFSALAPVSTFLVPALSLQNDIPVLFIHPWQILRPNEIPSMSGHDLMRRVGMMLYSRNCLGPLLYLLGHSQTVRLKDLALRVK
jgi:hypothetical protein